MEPNTGGSNGSNASDSSGESGWQDVEQDEEPLAVVSLFDTQTFPNPQDMLAHCKERHDFDFLHIVKSLGLDFYGAIRLVNFVRQSVQQGKPLPKQISSQDVDNEDYLKPVLENDALLFTLDEVLDSEQDVAGAVTAVADGSVTELLAQTKSLEAELEAVRTQFANYRLTVEETLDRRWGDDPEPKPATQGPKKDDSDYYFESYAAHGKVKGSSH